MPLKTISLLAGLQTEAEFQNLMAAVKLVARETSKTIFAVFCRILL